MKHLVRGDQVFFTFVNKNWVKYKKENMNKRLFYENFLNSVQNENTQFATMSFSNRKKIYYRKCLVINNFPLIKNINIIEPSLPNHSNSFFIYF